VNLTIDFSGPTPINEQISQWMRQNILSGAWPENYKLKSETDFSRELNVSRGTIRKAIESLIEEGLLIRAHGKGTFVKTNILFEQIPNGMVAGFSRDLINRGIPYSTEVLMQEIIPPPEKIARLLAIKTSDLIFHMKRLRKVHQKPIMIIENHIIYKRCKGLEKTDFSTTQLYNTLETKFGFDFDWARRTYKATIADEPLAKMLEIEQGSPVMYLEELYHLTGDIPAEFTRAWINADVFHITTRIKREDEKKDPARIYR